MIRKEIDTIGTSPRRRQNPGNTSSSLTTVTSDPSHNLIQTATSVFHSNKYDSNKMKQTISNFGSMKLAVLVILCLQNSIFTVLRRYSQGVLKETYSKYEVLLLGELMKIIFAGIVITKDVPHPYGHFMHLISTSKKMLVLALIYGLMNILSFVALRNISAGTFTVCAQLKILTTASFSSIMLNRKYSAVKWRALGTLMLSVLLFSEHIWNKSEYSLEHGNALLGTAAVITEVTLSGFASIYFEKVIKTDTQKFNIWERNFQLALTSFPIYVIFIASETPSHDMFSGWSTVSFLLSVLGAAGGLLVALSIKYGDAILKTLATTGSIVLSSLLDYLLLGGPLTAIMCISGVVVVIAICDYTFDPTPPLPESSIHPKDTSKIETEALIRADQETSDQIPKTNV